MNKVWSKTHYVNQVVQVKRVHPLAVLPKYQTLSSAGMDICAVIDNDPLHPCIFLHPGDVKIFNTGLSVAIPEGYEIQIRPRSGLAMGYGITVVNSPGTIDSDYRGEIMVALINLGKDGYNVLHGDRIAQMVLAPVCRLEWHEVNELPSTERGIKGFGSTGN